MWLTRFSMEAKRGEESRPEKKCSPSSLPVVDSEIWSQGLHLIFLLFEEVRKLKDFLEGKVLDIGLPIF